MGMPTVGLPAACWSVVGRRRRSLQAKATERPDPAVPHLTALTSLSPSSTWMCGLCAHSLWGLVLPRPQEIPAKQRTPQPCIDTGPAANQDGLVRSVQCEHLDACSENFSLFHHTAIGMKGLLSSHKSIVHLQHKRNSH